MGRSNDGARLRKWSLEYEKRQGRIRTPGRLEDLTRRARHVRQKRAGQTPARPTDAERARRRERRRRRNTRDPLGRPDTHTDTERQEWADLLRGGKATRVDKAALKRGQIRRRVDTARERHEWSKRIAAAAAIPPMKLTPAPERPRVELGRTVAGPPPGPAPMKLTPAPERPRVELGRTVAGPPPGPPPPMKLTPPPERYEPHAHNVQYRFTEAVRRTRESDAREAAVALAADQPAGLPWDDVEADLVKQHASDERYREQIDPGNGSRLDIGTARIDLETAIADEARHHRSHTPPVPRNAQQSAITAAVKAIQPHPRPTAARPRAPGPGRRRH